MKRLSLILPLFALSLWPLPVPASDLTLEQIESIKKQAEAIRENLDSHLSTRNTTAAERFAAAAGDPRATVALYLDCHKLVDFDREGRPDSDFRAWKDAQENNLKDPAVVESLQMQLRYLALSCRAAQSDEPEAVFAPLMSYMDALSNLENLPSNALTSSVANSIFAKAFYLERLLGNNPGWEAVPFNIGGMYGSTIFPYLREEKPDALMNAWDKRIEQESRIARMIHTHQEAAMRGLDRDAQRRERGRQTNADGILKSYSMEGFTNLTLPKLKWARLKDMFQHVSEVEATQAILPFLKEHLTHELGEDFFREFNQLINDAAVETDRLP